MPCMNSVIDVYSVLGQPSRSPQRRAISIISAIGPPPPSPWPKPTRRRSWTSLCCTSDQSRVSFAGSSSPCISLKCASTREPSMPCHQKVS